MKTILEKLKIRLVYKIAREQQINMFSGRTVIVKVPTGEIHIFEIKTKDGYTEIEPYSFCKKERAQIGEITEDSEKRPQLPMCPACEAKWKKHPRSPWRAWKEGKPL